MIVSLILKVRMSECRYRALKCQSTTFGNLHPISQLKQNIEGRDEGWSVIRSGRWSRVAPQYRPLSVSTHGFKFGLVELNIGRNQDWANSKRKCWMLCFVNIYRQNYVFTALYMKRDIWIVNQLQGEADINREQSQIFDGKGWIFVSQIYIYMKIVFAIVSKLWNVSHLQKRMLAFDHHDY